MKSLYEKKESNNAELIVTVDGETWKNAQNKARRKVAQNLQVPGFRKGHVPENMIDRYINRNEVMVEAAESVAQSALEFGLEENPDIRLIDRPQLDIDKISEEEVSLRFLLEVYPEVELGDYRSVEYKEAKVNVTKKEVDEEINRLRRQNAEEVLKEIGAVENGDIAVIDFEGFVDGVAFDGGKGTEYPLEIGSGSFIPGFEEQIIGMEVDEEKDINVTFPEQYAPELAGKAATFKVKLDGIKTRELPELNDEFVEELKMGEDVKTVDDLTKHIKAHMKEHKTADAEEKATNELLDQLCEVCKVDVPHVMIHNEMDDTYHNYENRLQQQGIDMGMYLKITGQTAESFHESLHEECEKKVRIRLILEAIGKDMGLEPTEEDLENEYKSMSEQYQMEVDQIKNLVPAEYLKDDIRMRMTLDALKKK